MTKSGQHDIVVTVKKMDMLTKLKREVTNVKIIKRKMTALLLSTVLMLISLSGCGAGSTSSNGSVSTIEKGVLKVGMNLKDSPMSYLNTDTARPDGFEAKVAEQVAEKLGLKLEIVDTTQKNLLKSLDADIYDCVISSVGMTEENCKKYEATNAYADVSAIEDELTENPENTKIAIFGKKNNGLIQAIEKQALEPLKEDGTLSEISKSSLKEDIIIK